jgi:hypothetical protein
MTPIISYKNFIKYATDKVYARKRLKRSILSQQMTISLAARSLKCSRITIRKLLNEDDLNYEARKAPKNCPHKLSKQIEETIKKYHKESGYGADMLKLNYNLSHSTASIHRVLVENGFVNTRNKKASRQKEINRIKKKLKAFEKWQFDTKYLTDIPNLVGPIEQGIVPKYEYTLRDMTTGTTFLGFAFKERSVKDSCSFVALCLYHMQLHGIDTHYVTIQSDNGPEILGKEDQIKDYEIRKVIEDKFRARFRTIPVRRPTFNSHVESFHGRVEREEYDRMVLKDPNDFGKSMKEYVLRFNTIRKALKSGKTPEMIAKEHGIVMDKCFYDFPILFYDTISSNYKNPVYSPGHYLPEEVKNLQIII